MANPTLVGIAGVHHVVSELSRRGMIALPTIRNVAAYDVIVVTMDGRRHANIQVKTSLKRVNFFPMPAVEGVRAGPRDWYVLLRWLSKEGRFEGFMLTGREARQEVELHRQRQKWQIASGTRKVLFPALYVAPHAEDNAKTKAKTEANVSKWLHRWLHWKL